MFLLVLTRLTLTAREQQPPSPPVPGTRLPLQKGSALGREGGRLFLTAVLLKGEMHLSAAVLGVPQHPILEGGEPACQLALPETDG